MTFKTNVAVVWMFVFDRVRQILEISVETHPNRTDFYAKMPIFANFHQILFWQFMDIYCPNAI